MNMIGFVGLGRMGRPMASNLSRKGFRLAVHDINRDAVAELELLQAKGVAVLKRDDKDENGRFAWLLDPEGNKVELWEPKR